MPVKKGKDVLGTYYRWGNATKYYYNPAINKSIELAILRASKQGKAIKANELRKYGYGKLLTPTLLRILGY